MGLGLTRTRRLVSGLALHFLPRGSGEQTRVMKVSTHSPCLLPHQPARLCPFPETHLLLFFLEMHSLVTAAGTITTMGTSNGNRMEAKLDASGVRGTEIGVWDKKRWGGDTPFWPSAATLEGLHSLHISGSWLSLQEAATPRAFKT